MMGGGESGLSMGKKHNSKKDNWGGGIMSGLRAGFFNK
jgi:hypothetical protein